MSTSLKYRVDPRDIPAGKAARRLHLSLSEFREMLPALYKRGFPKPDETTGMYDLDAIDAWRHRRHPHLFLTTDTPSVDANTLRNRVRGKAWRK